MLVKIYNKILNILPTLVPIDGKTWFKKFYRLSIINFLLSVSLMAAMFINTTALGIFLSNFIFLGIFVMLLVNDVNFFVICMERVLDVDLNPFIAFPLFLTSLLILYLMKLLLAEIIAVSSIVVGIVLMGIVVALNILVYRFFPSKNSTLID